jgi:hypothetical protein
MTHTYTCACAGPGASLAAVAALAGFVTLSGGQVIDGTAFSDSIAVRSAGRAPRRRAARHRGSHAQPQGHCQHHRSPVRRAAGRPGGTRCAGTAGTSTAKNR